MKTEWDYTELADAYLKRPGYAKTAIEEMIKRSDVKEGDAVCDVGAGAAHLTIELARCGLSVSAIEPNDAMRRNGIIRTSGFDNVKWYEGVGEHTGMDDHMFNLVTFGSSFNVCDRALALKECERILVPQGWFACMWNHRNLDDPLQKSIEDVLKSEIKNYSYGSRREDQTPIIEESGLFEEVIFFEGSVIHQTPVDDFVEGWKSHGTVQRQSLEKFDIINKKIEAVIRSVGKDVIEVPYTTRIWMARLKQ